MEKTDTKKRTVLIIDDKDEDRALLAMLLQKDELHKYVVYEAGDADAGLKFCRTCEIDCIILDLDMPGPDGLDFMVSLVAQFGKVLWPVIMLTGYGNEEIAVEAMKRGARDYMVKSRISAPLLHRAVDNAIDDMRTIRKGEKRQLDHKKEKRDLEGKVKELRNRVQQLEEIIDDLKNEILRSRAEIKEN